MSLAHPDTIQAAVDLLDQGSIVAFPTETVYGLGANAWDAAAIAKIYAAKGRPSNNPLIVHLHDASCLAQAVALPLEPAIDEMLERLLPFWPGPLTLILPRSSRIPLQVTAGRETVAVRVPNHPVAQQLLAACPFPLAAPSANRSTAVSPTSAQHVRDELGDRVPLILDGGPSQVGLESTILSLVETPPRILRHGYITAEQLAEALDVDVQVLLRPAAPVAAADPAGFASPGQMSIHYAPRTPVVLRPHWHGSPDLKAALISFAPGTVSPEERASFSVTRSLSSQGDLAEVARRLFATLREVDQLGLDVMVIDTCDETGLGRAIMDRLRRAAARSNHASELP